LRKIIILIASLALVLLIAVVSPFGSAQADSDGAPCNVPTITVVDSPAHVVHHDAVTHDEVVHHDAVTHTEVIHHDAVTHVVHHDAVPAGPDLWWNWAPNHTDGPQDYVPDFPTDDRGTWEGPHENGGPLQDTYGTFQTGGGNSPFFHREHGKAAVAAYDEIVVDQPAYDETITVIDQPAYDETVTIVDQEAYDENVPAVTHEEDNPNYPCENPPPTDVNHPTKHAPGTTLQPKPEAPAVPTEVEAGL
jgi:hypothetical protein